MSKQQKETVTMALLMLFFLDDFYCCYYYFVGTEFFFLAFVNKQNFKRLRDIHLSGRGADSLACISWATSFLLRGAFFGRLFYFNWQCGFFPALHRHSLWPA